MSQRELASASGVSCSLIRTLEQGERQDTRLETLRRLAEALETTTSALARTDEPGHLATPALPSARWDEVRAALLGTEGDVAEAPTAGGVRAAVEAATHAYRNGHFDQVAVLLPGLIRDTQALADLAPAEGGPLRTRALTMTGRLMTQTHAYDIAEVALERALRLAPDRTHAVVAVDLRCWLMLRQGRFDRVREFATQWADDIEPRLSQARAGDLALWGWLLLRAAAAARDNRGDEAEEALRLAHAAAIAAGRPVPLLGPGFIHPFSTSAVEMQQAEHAMVRGRPDRVLRIASRIDTQRLRAASGAKNRHLLDVAHAQALTRRYPQAVGTLLGIHRDAPEWLPHQRYAQDIMRLIADRRRTLTPEMRHLADVVRLEL